MKKIFASELNGWNESTERIYVYALENEDEWWELESSDHDKLCEIFGVYEEFNVAPGALYYTYEFSLYGNHIVMAEKVSYNV